MGYRVMVTGHRDVRGDRAIAVRESLRQVLTGLRARREALVVALSGMAIGADIEFAEVALDLGIPLVAALPLEGQDSVWPEHARRRYRDVLGRAACVVEVWKDPLYLRATVNARLHARNLWLLDYSDLVIAVWDGRETGGTWAAVKEALKRGRKIMVVNPHSGAVSISQR